jgi:dTDP-4-amino-4,6-dideoxygalactose transaminase
MEMVSRATKANQYRGSAAAGPQRTPVPFHQVWIGDEEIREVVRALESGLLASGPKAGEFEEAFARYLGVRHAVAVGCGAIGLRSALEVVGIQPGDEVITSVYASPATVGAILQLRGRPVFVDVTHDTLTTDWTQAEQKITGRTRLAVAVHEGGVPCEIDEIPGRAARGGLIVMEDAAQALPARYKGRMVGSIGDLSVFRFDAMKTITTGEGGIVATNRDDYAQVLRTGWLPGIDVEAWPRRAGLSQNDLPQTDKSWQMSDINAALGVEQLSRVERFHAIRSYHAGLYDLGLSDLPELVLPEPCPTDREQSWHSYVIRLRRDGLTIDRDTFVQLMLEQGIETNTQCIPHLLHPRYRDILGYEPTTFPHALQAYQTAVALPLYPRMSEANVWDVIATVRRIVERYRVRRAL